MFRDVYKASTCYIGNFISLLFILYRDQKAQLLLVNIAIAADILELFEIMKEEEVKLNITLVTIVLTLWTCSLIQVRAHTSPAQSINLHCFCGDNSIDCSVACLLSAPITSVVP